MDVVVDAAANVYIAGMVSNRVRKDDNNGLIATVAGDGRQGRGPDGVAASASSLHYPPGLALDGSGNLYIVDWQNYIIRKVTCPAPPAINAGGIANAASFAASPVAPGSLISIFGTNLCIGAPTLADGAPWKTQMSGASVALNGPGILQQNIPLYFVSAVQINAQMPYGLAEGSYSLTVTTSAGGTPPQPFPLAPAPPGVFTTAPPPPAPVQEYKQR